MTTTNQNSVNKENQTKKATRNSGSNNQNQQNNATRIVVPTNHNRNLNRTNGQILSEQSKNSSNWIKLQSLKLRKFELELLLNQKTMLLQEIQNQEAILISGDKTQKSCGVNDIKYNNIPLTQNGETKNLRDRKCFYSKTEYPLKSSSLNNFDLFSAKNDNDGFANKSDLVSVLSFKSEKTSTKLKEKPWFDSSLDGPIIRISTPIQSNNNKNNNFGNNKTINKNFYNINNKNDANNLYSSKSPHSIFTYQTPSPTNDLNSQLSMHKAASYQYNSNKLRNFYSLKSSQNHQRNIWSKHLHYNTTYNSSIGKTTNRDSSCPEKSNSLFQTIEKKNSHGGTENANKIINSRQKNNRDRLKLSSQSMSSARNNFYKMQVIKLEDLSHLSLSTSILNDVGASSEEPSHIASSFNSKANRNKIRNTQKKGNTYIFSKKSSMKFDDFLPTISKNNVEIDISSLSTIHKICNENISNEKQVNLSDSILNYDPKNYTSSFAIFSSDNHMSLSIPSAIQSDISFKNPLSSTVEKCEIKPAPNSFDNIQHSSKLSVANSQIKRLSESLPQNRLRPLSPSITAKNIIKKYSDVGTEPSKNITIVQQATFMPYKEESKPFEMSDFYKYSTKFRQKETSKSVTVYRNYN